MKHILALAVIVGVVVTGAMRAQSTQADFNAFIAQEAASPTALAFSTYLGGSGEDTLRDVAVDAQGNVYVVGATNSSNFPRTLGSAHNTGSCPTLGTGGRLDVFVTKFSASGTRLWSRVMGGPCYDRAYAVEVDYQGNVYIAGRAGAGFPTTSGSLQRTFGGDVVPASLYGQQDGFIAKLTSAGGIVWVSYFGGNDAGIIRDLDVDAAGDVYVVEQGVTRNHPYISTTAFQKTRAGDQDLVIAKLSPTGQVDWATYFGGSGYEGEGASIRVSSNGQPVVLATTRSTNLPLKNAFQSTSKGNRESVLAKLTADGSALVFSTYFGGSGDEGVETHHLGLDASNNIFFGVSTSSPNFPVTTNGYQRTLRGVRDIGLAKFSPIGQRIAATYLGGSAVDGHQGLVVDSLGRVTVFGASDSTNFPTTVDAFRRTNAGGMDVIVATLSADLRQLVYGTYLGGTKLDQARAGALDDTGNLIVGGWTLSTNYPVVAASQGTFAGGSHDVIVTSLVR